MRSLILIPVLALAACNISSGAEATGGGSPAGGAKRSYDVGEFNSIALGGRHNVVVKVGGAASVRAEGPEDVLDNLKIVVSRGTLRIEDRHNDWSRRGEGAAATIHVTVPSLEGASLGGSGNISIDKVGGRRFAASIGGSGDIGVAKMAVEDATFSIAGSGNLTAAGTAGSVKLSLVGSGDVDAARLASRTVHVSVAGSGDAVVRASERAAVSMVGSGDVTIHGGAECSVSKVGSGEVHCPG